MTTQADRSIVEFIDHARSKGMDHATIRMLLLSAGWKEKEALPQNLWVKTGAR